MESWVQTTMIAAGTALSGAVGILWRHQVTAERKTEDKLEKAEDKLEKCEEKHEGTLAKIIDLTDQMGGLREELGRLRGVEELAKEVLREVSGKQSGDDDERDGPG